MHAPQGRGRRLRPGGHPRVWALIVAMGAGALALTLTHVSHLPALGPHPRPAWWLLAAAFAVAELCVVHVEFRRNVHIFSLSELPLVFGLIFAQPWAMLLGILLGPIVVLVVNRGQSPVKVAFNITLFWLGGAVAATIFHALLGAQDVVGPTVWGAALLATLANAVLGALLVCAVIRLSGQPIAMSQAPAHAGDGDRRLRDQHVPGARRGRGGGHRRMGRAAAPRPRRGRGARLSRLHGRAAQAREPRVPARGDAPARPRARHQRRHRRAAAAHARRLPRRRRRDHPAALRPALGGAAHDARAGRHSSSRWCSPIATWPMPCTRWSTATRPRGCWSARSTIRCSTRPWPAAASSARCSPPCRARRGWSAPSSSPTAAPGRELRQPRPHALRHAGQPRERVAGVRPPRAPRLPAARAAGPPRAPGLPRPADRPRQPRAVPRPARRAARLGPARLHGPLPGPRRLQDDQRLARATRSATSCWPPSPDACAAR